MAIRSSAYIDITRPLHGEMPVWPGDPPFELDWAARISVGDPVNVAAVRTGVHAGTHVDAPYHVLEKGGRIDEVSPEVFIGPAVVMDVRGRYPIDRDQFERILEGASRPERILLRTGAWRTDDEFPTAFPCPTVEAAELIATAGVRLLGTDAPSVDPPDSEGLPVHRALLSSGVCILENLLLDDVEAGEYDLIALPLRLREADASPVRAVLRRR
jgi:arylformamidase